MSDSVIRSSQDHILLLSGACLKRLLLYLIRILPMLSRETCILGPLRELQIGTLCLSVCPCFQIFAMRLAAKTPGVACGTYKNNLFILRNEQYFEASNLCYNKK